MYVVDQPLNVIDAHVDLLEIRVDLCSNFIPKDHPWILTIRRKEDGGNFQGSEKNRWELLETYLKFYPDYVDLEADVPICLVQKIKKKYPTLKCIRSYHNFEKTPLNLEKQLLSMSHPIFDLYKIATFANSSLDALRMIRFVKQSNYLVSGICMGEKGEITRLGPLFQNAMDYTSKNSLNGQIPLQDLLQIYRYPTLTKDTAIYALIGDPISHSVGPLFHNRFFSLLDENSVYLKIPLQAKEFVPFFSIVKDLPFLGFSITTPLKDEVEKIDLKGPLNTLKKKQTGWTGDNTDGKGAVLALQDTMQLKGKKGLILGAGATAQSIASQGVKKDLFLSVFHRNPEKAEKVFPKTIQVLSSLCSADHFDILINTISSDIEEHTSFSIKKWLTKPITVFDVSYKKEKTSLVQIAEQKQCKVISGLHMFFYQAILQQQIWQGKLFEQSLVETVKKRWKQDLHQYGYVL